MPTPSPSPLIYEGAFDASARRVVNQSFAQQLASNTTVVQATNPTATASLMSAVLQPGALSRVGQTLSIFGSGITNLTTTTGALTLTVNLGAVALAAIATGAVAVGALNLPWQLNLLATVVSVDSGGNVVLECHGTLGQALTTTVAGLTTYNDVNVAVLTAVPGANSLTLQVQCIMSGGGNAASFVNQRQLIVTLLN